MSRSTWLPTAFVVVTVAYAALATVWNSHDPGWYASLARPRIQPPDWVFGVMWPLNFLALGVVGFRLGRDQANVAGPVLVVFVVSVGAALTWAYLFYVPHRLTPAAVALGMAAALTWVMVVLAARAGVWYGVGLVPYATWLSIATALSVGYARLN
jgi:translocator protein